MKIQNLPKLAATLLVLPLVIAVIGCSANDELTCDGGRPVADPQTAVRGLLEAAETTDYDKACSVISLKLTNEAMNGPLTALKHEMDSKEVTSSNFKMIEYDRGGSAHFYNIYADQPDIPLEFTLVEIGKGYRVAFGEEP